MSLELRVTHLEELVLALRSRVAHLESLLSPRARSASFEVVAQTPTPRSYPRASSPERQATRTPVVVSSGLEIGPPAAPTASASASSQETGEQRAAACREIGLFLRRAVNVLHRGASGRDRLSQQSRLWLVVRDFEGTRRDPVVVCHKFSQCAQLCKRGSECGDSVFVGLPARRDVIAVCAAGDFQLPASW